MGAKALQGVSDSPAFHCSPVLREALNVYLADIDHEYAVGLAFGFSHSPLLASFSAAAWWALEEAEIEKQGYDRTMVEWHQGPVTQHSLQALEKNRGVSVGLWDYKLHTMEWMAARGLGGTRDVLFATSAKLKK
jgi:centromere protein I